MNKASKIVFSRTLEKAEWVNTRLVRCEAALELPKLRQEPGGNLIIFGSANLSSSLTRAGLIDDYRIMVTPMVLGKGRPQFEGVSKRLDLKLVRVREFRSGNVLLHYKPQ